MHIPDRVLRGQPVHVGKNVKAWYAPANSRRDLPAKSRMEAMDSFLMSDDLLEVTWGVAADMVSDARQEALAQGLTESGEYVSSFERRPGPIVNVESQGHANPRLSVEVGNTSGHAAAVEYGTSKDREAHRVLGKVGARYHTDKGDIA